MNYKEARKLLEIPDGENFEEHKERLERQRQELLKSIRKAPKRHRADWQSDLVLFDRALSIVSTYQAPSKAPMVKAVAVFSAIGLALAGGLFWKNIEADKKRMADLELKVLEVKPLFESAISERKWDDAKKLLDNVSVMKSDASFVIDGQKRIDDGLAEEKRQQVEYNIGKIKAAIEAEDWEGAEGAIAALAQLDSAHLEIEGSRKEIALRRKEQVINTLITDTRKKLDVQDWAGAQQLIEEFQALDARNVAIAELISLKQKGLDQEVKDKEESRRLTAQAQALDTGQFSASALDMLQTAVRLDPKNTAASSLLEKMSNYTQTINVALGDNLQQIIDNATSRSRIILAEGTFEGALTVKKGIEIIGAARDKTILTCEGKDGSVIDVLGTQENVRISKLTLQHKNFEYGNERFALLNIVGGSLKVEDCEIKNGSGHGVYIENSKVEINASSVQHNAWNGVTVVGDSKVKIATSLLFENFHNGVEAYNGGDVSINRCRAALNGRNGVTSSSSGKELNITASVCNENTEAGIYVSEGVQAVVDGNECNYNGVAGIFVRAKGTGLKMSGNKAIRNSDVGIAIEKGLTPTTNEGNKSEGNRNKDFVTDTEF